MKLGGRKIDSNNVIIAISLLAVGAWVVITNFGLFDDPPSPQMVLTKGSKTPRCREDVTHALKDIAKQQGLRFTVSAGDADAFFAGRELQKSYTRDGVTLTCHFRLSSVDAGCALEFYKRTRRQPGEVSSDAGSFATMVLNRCQCQPAAP